VRGHSDDARERPSSTSADSYRHAAARPRKSERRASGRDGPLEPDVSTRLDSHRRLTPFVAILRRRPVPIPACDPEIAVERLPPLSPGGARGFRRSDACHRADPALRCASSNGLGSTGPSRGGRARRSFGTTRLRSPDTPHGASCPARTLHPPPRSPPHAVTTCTGRGELDRLASRRPDERRSHGASRTCPSRRGAGGRRPRSSSTNVSNPR
jgi:hypothetical protein